MEYESVFSNVSIHLTIDLQCIQQRWERILANITSGVRCHAFITRQALTGGKFDREKQREVVPIVSLDQHDMWRRMRCLETQCVEMVEEKRWRRPIATASGCSLFKQLFVLWSTSSRFSSFPFLLSITPSSLEFIFFCFGKDSRFIFSVEWRGKNVADIDLKLTLSSRERIEREREREIAVAGTYLSCSFLCVWLSFTFVDKVSKLV